MRHLVTVGLSYAPSRVEYDRLSLPFDIFDATAEQVRAFLHRDFRKFPDWALMSMLPGMGGRLFSRSRSTVVFLTSTSASD